MNIKRDGKASGLKSKAVEISVKGVDIKGAPVKANKGAAKGKDEKKLKADKRSLIKAALAFSFMLVVGMVWFGSRAPTVADKAPVHKSVADSTMPTVAKTVTEALPVKGKEGAEGGTYSADSAKIGPIVSVVRITPSQPLLTDRIKAEPLLSGGYTEGVSFSYRWKINDKFVQGGNTDTLANADLKRRDRVSVVVSATRDGEKGPGTESQTVVVHSPPPTLAMKIMTEQFRPGDTVEIQLLGAAPDGDRLVFSLITPFVEGMKLEGNSGKILWTPQLLLPGKLQFGAAVTDSDGNRTARVFKIDLSAGSSS